MLGELGEALLWSTLAKFSLGLSPPYSKSQSPLAKLSLVPSSCYSSSRDLVRRGWQIPEKYLDPARGGSGFGYATSPVLQAR